VIIGFHVAHIPFMVVLNSQMIPLNFDPKAVAGGKIRRPYKIELHLPLKT